MYNGYKPASMLQCRKARMPSPRTLPTPQGRMPQPATHSMSTTPMLETASQPRCLGRYLCQPQACCQPKAQPGAAVDAINAQQHVSHHLQDLSCYAGTCGGRENTWRAGSMRLKARGKQHLLPLSDIACRQILPAHRPAHECVTSSARANRKAQRQAFRCNRNLPRWAPLAPTAHLRQIPLACSPAACMHDPKLRRHRRLTCHKQLQPGRQHHQRNGSHEQQGSLLGAS